MDGFKEIDDFVKRFRHRKVESADSPHENEREGPKPQRAVQRPAKSFGVLLPLDSQAAAPIPDTRPPDNRTAQAQQDRKNRAGGVPAKPGFSVQQIVMQVSKPQDFRLPLAHALSPRQCAEGPSAQGS